MPRGALADKGLFLVKSVEHPLQILQGVLLAVAAELCVILGQQDLEVIGFDTFLVLLFGFDLVDRDRLGLFLRVGAAVKAPEDLGYLAVETVPWNFFACG